MNLFIKSLLVAIMVAGFMVFFTTGCTQSIPEIEAGLKIPAPYFEDAQTDLSSLSNPTADGFCHKMITRIELRIAGENWKNLSEIDPTSQVTCATDGKFRFNADFSTGYLGAAKQALVAGKTVKLEVRGFGKILMSEIGSVLLRLGSGYPASLPVAVMINQVSSGASFKMTAQVGFKENPETSLSSSGNYQLRGIVRSRQ